MLSPFSLIRATSLEDASTAVQAGAIPYVGGTELVAAMHLGLVAPDALVDLKGVPGLDRIKANADGLVLGAAARHEAIADHDEIARSWPVLGTACAELGNQRVRATGSIGGNLCWADPRSDISTALVALEATVTLCSTQGRRRTLPVDDFVLGAMEVDITTGELLESIHVPRVAGRQVYVRHQPSEYPTVAVALVQSASDGVRLTVGAVCERPRSIQLRSLDDPAIGEYIETLDVMEDLNGSADYKRHLTGVFVRRAAAQLRELADD